MLKKVRTIRGITGLLLAGLLLVGCTKNESSNELLFLEDTSVNQSEEDTQIDTNELEEESVEVYDYEEETVITYISVYVCGAVNVPGVYELEEGSRMYEAIELAGGMTSDGMESYLNLAEVLTDAQKIYIPTEEEVDTGVILGSTSSVYSESTSDKVNINTATKEELMTLTGIGEAKAEAIITYRETVGFFEAPEDIQNISGIKEAVYEAIQDEITTS